MNCSYCGKRKRKGITFYKLDNKGHEICRYCLRNGYAKSALEIIKHNENVDKERVDNEQRKAD